MTASTQRQSREVGVFPIRSDEDLDRALAEVDKLLSAARPTRVKRDRLEVLTTLIEAYEELRYPIEAPSAIEAIKFRLDQLGFSTTAEQTKALQPMLGSRARVYEVMHGRRALSAQMVVKLWRKLGIPLESLVMGMTMRNGAARRKARGRRRGYLAR